MEFYIAPLVLYVEINPNKDTYSLSTDGQGAGQITISYSQVTLLVNNLDPTDEMWEYIDELPSGMTVRISGSATYTEAGLFILDPDSFTIYITSSTNVYLDAENYVIIPIYGVITIEP